MRLSIYWFCRIFCSKPWATVSSSHSHFAGKGFSDWSMNGGTGDDAARWIHGLAPLDCLAQAVHCRETADADGSAQDLHA
jgi:hypothetical protein